MSIKRSLALLALLFVTAIAIAAIAGYMPSRFQQQTTETPMRELPPPAPLTANRTIEAIGTKSFSALVSFTGTRFEPSSVRVSSGDTIRFFNGSQQSMTLSLSGAPAQLPPGEYFEFTFASVGTVQITEQGSGVPASVLVQ